jgi:hypothetical protein
MVYPINPQRQIGFFLEFLYGYRSSSAYRPEMLAKRYDLNVILQSKKKNKRGYYEATLIPISDDSNQFLILELPMLLLRS